MQSQRRRRYFTFIVIAAAGAICGIPWSANAVVHRASHARAAATEAAAFVAPALKEAKQALKSKIDAQLVSSTKSAGQYLRGIRKASAALAASLLSQSAPPMSKPGGASPAPALGAYPTLDSVLTDSTESRAAVYDISARTVYLPDGRQLEAHSGLGKFRDDVRSVKEKNRGVTPPNVYDLALREQRFHGVQALRLMPVSESPMYGRDGILAHTYMLGTTGQSNGCVVFKDYPAFLQAYLSGQVSRLVVVTSMTAAVPAQMRLAGR